MRAKCRSLFDVPLWETGVAAACVVVLGYTFILPGVRGTQIGRTIIVCGWVGVAVWFLGAWSLGILLLKTFRLIRHRRLLDEVVLPDYREMLITTETAPQFIRYLQSRFPSGKAAHPVEQRLESALRQLAYGHQVPSVLQDLHAQSQVDLDELESSYTMIRAFVWAVPIFGFIGTVVGIGQAIGGFASSLRLAEDLATIKSALGHVVTGLAFAFETTYLGLIVSLLVVFPMSMVHRFERSLVLALDECCTQQLMPRLRDAGASQLTNAISELTRGLSLLRSTPRHVQDAKPE